MTIRTHATAGFALLAILLAGCGTDEAPDLMTELDQQTGEEVDQEEPEPPEATDDGTPAAYSDACGAAVAEAAAVGDMEDTVEDLDPAMVACGSVEELQAAADDNPGALDVDAATWASNRCLYSEDEAVTNSAICDAVAESQ